MSIEVSCPNCATQFKAPDRKAGKKARCSKCGNSFRLPGAVPQGIPVDVLPLPDDDEPVAMATLAEPTPPPKARQTPPKPTAPEPLSLDEQPEKPRRRYVPPGEQQSSKVLLFALVLSVLAIGGAIAAVVVMMNKNKDKEPPQAKTEKQDPPPVPPDAPPNEQPKTRQEPPEIPVPIVVNPPDPPQVAALVAVSPTARTFQLRPQPVKPQLLQPASKKTVQVETPFEKVKRVFPTPSRATHDTIVVWQSTAGVGGRGERLTVDIYSGMIGARTGRFEYDGDGKDTKCDVSADGKFFAAVTADGKLAVWNLADNAKVLDGFDPYATLPEHKKAGLAAVFFAARSEHLVTVSSAGAVHMFDVATRQRLGEFVPRKGVAGRVVLGKSVNADESRASVVVAVAGVIYQVTTAAPLSVAWQLDLEGDVSRSLGIAVYGTPGRVAFAFETDDGKKSQRVLVLCLPKNKPTMFLWPEAAGEPNGLVWSGGKFTIVSTTRGAVWVEAEGKQFTPLALGEVPGGKGLHAATENAHWYLVPNPADAAKSVLVELTMPPDGLLDFRAAADAKLPLFTVRLDDKGLAK